MTWLLLLVSISASADSLGDEFSKLFNCVHAKKAGSSCEQSIQGDKVEKIFRLLESLRREPILRPCSKEELSFFAKETAKPSRCFRFSDEKGMKRRGFVLFAKEKISDLRFF